MKKNEIFLMAGRFDGQKDPDYPIDLLGKKIAPVLVCVDVVVQGDGTLSEAKINHTGDPCDRDTNRDGIKEFEDAALKTVKGWAFAGGAICRYPVGRVADEKCEGEGVQMEPVPVRLTYTFDFVQKNGKASVRQRTK